MAQNKTVKKISKATTVKANFDELRSLQKGDIILAKHKSWSFWPALVSSVYPKYLTVIWIPFSFERKNDIFRIPFPRVKLLERDDLGRIELLKDDGLKEAFQSAKNLLKMTRESRFPFKTVQKSNKSLESKKKRPHYEYILEKIDGDASMADLRAVSDMYSRVKETRRQSPEKAKVEIEERKPAENIQTFKIEKSLKSDSEQNSTIETCGLDQKNKEQPKTKRGRPKSLNQSLKKAKIQSAEVLKLPEVENPVGGDTKRKRGRPKKKIENEKGKDESYHQSSAETLATRGGAVRTVSQDSCKTGMLQGTKPPTKGKGLACVRRVVPSNRPVLRSGGVEVGIEDDIKTKEKEEKGTLQRKPTKAKEKLAEKVHVDFDENEESSEEFPSLARLSSNLEELEAIKPKFSRGDIVWVKYGRWPAWPSLVTKYDSKSKKISFDFLPVDFTTKNRIRFRVSVSKVEPYMSAYHRNFTASKLDNLQILDAVKQADRIRKGLLNPFTVPDSPSTSKLEVPILSKFRHVELPSTEDDELPSVGNSDHPEEPESPSGIKEIEERKANNQLLMDKILSEETKEFLAAVYREEVENWRQSEWNRLRSAMPAPKSFGPIIDEDQIEDLIEQLSAWYQEVNPDASVRNTFTYIACVWLPEAVKLAMKEIMNTTDEEVEEQLNSFPTNYTNEELSATKDEMLSMNTSAFDQLVAVACRERDSL